MVTFYYCESSPGAPSFESLSGEVLIKIGWVINKNKYILYNKTVQLTKNVEFNFAFKRIQLDLISQISTCKIKTSPFITVKFTEVHNNNKFLTT